MQLIADLQLHSKYSRAVSPQMTIPLIAELDSEFQILLRSSLEEIVHIAGQKIADGVSKVRTGDIAIDPGYDGVFGKVKIWKEEKPAGTSELSKDQLALF